MGRCLGSRPVGSGLARPAGRRARDRARARDASASCRRATHAMGHSDIWASHPANYGKGSRRWCARRRARARRDAIERGTREAEGSRGISWTRAWGAMRASEGSGDAWDAWMGMGLIERGARGGGRAMGRCGEAAMTSGGDGDLGLCARERETDGGRRFRVQPRVRKPARDHP